MVVYESQSASAMYPFAHIDTSLLFHNGGQNAQDTPDTRALAYSQKDQCMWTVCLRRVHRTEFTFAVRAAH